MMTRLFFWPSAFERCQSERTSSTKAWRSMFVVIALLVTEAKSPWLDGLAIILLLARITQSLLHIGPTQTELVAGARFGFYAINRLHDHHG